MHTSGVRRWVACTTMICSICSNSFRFVHIYITWLTVVSLDSTRGEHYNANMRTGNKPSLYYYDLMLLFTRVVATYPLGIGGDTCLSLIGFTPVATGGALCSLVGAVLNSILESLTRTSSSIGTLTAATAMRVGPRDVGTVEGWWLDSSIGLG
jgi:hypothetical protein